jgi:catechol 2,3-dioxygenase-like lactoylglutathione lyase family enzyme
VIGMRTQTLITVADVEASSRWYQDVLGATSGHGGPEYERLLVAGRLVLQLHDRAVDHHHGLIDDPGQPRGIGVLLWFEADSGDDFDAAVARVRACGARVSTDVHVNPNARHREIWLRDPDGCAVVLAGPDDEREA